MRKKRSYLLLILTLLSLSTVYLASRERWGIGAYVGGVFPKEKNFDNGLSVGLKLQLRLSDRIALALDSWSWRSAVDKNEENLFDGKLSVYPTLLKLYYYHLKEAVFRPYIFGGLGIVRSHFSLGGYISIPEVHIRQKVKSGIGYSLGLGGDIRLARHLNLFTEIIYLWRKAEGETTYYYFNTPCTEHFPLNLDSSVFKAGLKFVF